VFFKISQKKPDREIPDDTGDNSRDNEGHKLSAGNIFRAFRSSSRPLPQPPELTGERRIELRSPRFSPAKSPPIIVDPDLLEPGISAKT